MPKTHQPADPQAPRLQLFHRSEIGAATLRFGLGDRVECLYNEGTWQPGTVFRLFYHEPKFGKDMCVPYQIILDDPAEYPGKLIFSPRDDPSILRASAKVRPRAHLTPEPHGRISPSANTVTKVAQLVDLLLAPSGAAVLMGLPAMINQSLGQRGFDGPLLHLTTDELEVNAALVLLGTLAAEGDESRQHIREHMALRPASLEVLCQYIAFTPPLGPEENVHPEFPNGWSSPAGDFKSRSSKGHASATQPRGCTANTAEGEVLGLSPPQATETYMQVMMHVLTLLTWLASQPADGKDTSIVGASAFTRRLCASPSLPACVEKLHELATRAGEPALGRLPARAMDALTALTAAHPRPRWLLRSLEPSDGNLVGGYDAQHVMSPMNHLIDDCLGVSDPPHRPRGSLTEVDKSNVGVLLSAYGDGLEEEAHDVPQDAAASFDALMDAASADGDGVADALVKELARCHTPTERKVATQWMLDHMLLPIGRVVVLRDLASRPGLNGEPALLAGAHRDRTDELRYPVRPLSQTYDLLEGGALIAMRPRNFVVSSEKVAAALAKLDQLERFAAAVAAS